MLQQVNSMKMSTITINEVQVTISIILEVYEIQIYMKKKTGNYVLLAKENQSSLITHGSSSWLNKSEQCHISRILEISFRRCGHFPLEMYHLYQRCTFPAPTLTSLAVNAASSTLDVVASLKFWICDTADKSET